MMDETRGDEQPGLPSAPPMATDTPQPTDADAGTGEDGEQVGNENIRQGRVGGTLGPPRGSEGQGQGG